MWPFSRKETGLRDHLKAGKKIKVHGVIFHIRKLNVADYLEGSRVMQEIYATYKTNTSGKIDKKAATNSVKKAREYMTDVIVGGVVKPVIVRKPGADPEAICIEEVFQDWNLAQELTNQIMLYTYSKKK